MKNALTCSRTGQIVCLIVGFLTVVLGWSAWASGSYDSFTSRGTFTGSTGLFSYPNTSATLDTGEAKIYNRALGKSLWFQWTAPYSTSCTFSTENSAVDTVMGIYVHDSIEGALGVTTLDNLYKDDDDSDINPACRIVFNATANTTYYIAVDTVGVAGNIRLSLNQVVPAPTPTPTPTALPVPAAPVITSAVAGNREVTLTWSTAARADDYFVKYSEDGGATWKGGAFDYDYRTYGTTFVFNTLVDSSKVLPYKEYKFKVNAWNGSGESPDSNMVAATPTGLRDAPVITSATAGNRKVTLAWNAVPGAGDYFVYYSEDGGTTWKAGAYNYSYQTTATTFEVNELVDGNPLVAGKLYKFKVRAWNGTGGSADSNTVSATPTGVPAAPVITSAHAGNAQVALSWSAAEGAADYYVAYSTNGGTTWQGGTVGGFNTNYRAFGTTFNFNALVNGSAVVNGTTYTFKVNAWNGTGGSDDSNLVAATPTDVPGASVLSAVAGNASVGLSWTAAVRAADYYVQYSEDNGATWKGGAFNTSYRVFGTTFTFDKLVNGSSVVNGQSYRFKVVAWNGSGAGPDSNVVSATPVAPAPTPTATALPTSTPTPTPTPTAVPASRPDAQVRKWSESTGDYVGANVYNSTGSGQEKAQTVAAGVAATYLVLVENDGNTSNTFKITGPGDANGWLIRYYDNATNTAISTDVTGAGWTSGSVAANGSIAIRVTATPQTTSAYDKEVLLTATGVSNGAFVDAAKMTTTRSSSRPDAQVRNHADAANVYVGNDVYNSTGASQSRAQSVAPGVAATYYVKIENDGDAADTFKVTGPGDSNGWLIRYYDNSNNAVLTTDVIGAGWTSGSVAAGGSIVVRVTATCGTTAADEKEVLLSAAAVTSTGRTDSVKMTTTKSGSRPDAQARNHADAAGVYVGNDVYNSTGVDQAKDQAVAPGVAATYYVKIENDGDTGDTFKITGTGDSNGWLIRYYDNSNNSVLTTDVTGTGWTSGTVAPGASIVVRVTATCGTTAADEKEVLLTATSVTTVGRSDSAKLTTTRAYPRPDAQISSTTTSNYVGDGVYNTTAAGQEKTLSIDPASGATALYYILIQNDGEASDTFKITGPGDSSGWLLRYYEDISTRPDITASVIGSGWSTTLAPGAYARIYMTARAATTAAFELPALVTVTSTLGARTDAVQAVTTKTGAHLDASIRNHADTDYIGDRIINTTGAGQTKTQAVAPGVPANFYVKVENPGTVADSFLIFGTSAPTGWLVQYYDNSTNNVLNMTGGAAWTVAVQPGTSKVVRVTATPQTAAPGNCELQVVSRNGANTKQDVVKAVAETDQRIVKLQYSLNEGVSWTDVPQSGDAGYPLTVDQGTIVDFKAIKTFPNAPWPDGKPEWSGNGWADEVGEESWEHFTDNSVNSTDLKVVTAESINTVTANVKVNALYDIYIWSEYDALLGGGSPSDLATMKVYAEVVDMNGDGVPNASVTFTSKYGDNSQAGQINQTGSTDDTVTTDNDGIAEITLTSGRRIEDVVLTASTTNQSKTITDGVNVAFERPEASVVLGSWFTDGNGQKKRTCDVSLTYYGVPLASRPIELEGYATDANDVLFNTLAFAASSGTTDSGGVFSTHVHWNYTPQDPQDHTTHIDVYDTTIDD